LKILFCQEAVLAVFSRMNFGAMKISGNEMLIGSLTRSEQKMAIFDQIDDCWGPWTSQPSFRFHDTMYQFCVLRSLAKN